MILTTFQTHAGEVVLGMAIPHGFIPVLIWPTWSEYVAFVERMNQFIESTYQADSMKQSFIRCINSIEAIDAL
jgi:hypothetical protein